MSDELGSDSREVGDRTRDLEKIVENFLLLLKLRVFTMRLIS